MCPVCGLLVDPMTYCDVHGEHHSTAEESAAHEEAAMLRAGRKTNA